MCSHKRIEIQQFFLINKFFIGLRRKNFKNVWKIFNKAFMSIFYERNFQQQRPAECARKIKYRQRHEMCSCENIPLKMYEASLWLSKIHAAGKRNHFKFNFYRRSERQMPEMRKENVFFTNSHETITGGVYMPLMCFHSTPSIINVDRLNACTA